MTHKASKQKHESVRAGRTRTRGPVAPWWFILPALALYLFVVIVPTMRGGFYAFTDWNGLGADWKFVGLDNFGDVFSDRRARASLQNTLILSLVVTVLQNLIALALAVALDGALKSRSVLRVIFFTPVVLTPLVAGYIWSYLLAPQGAVNALLTSVGLGSVAHDWLGDPSTALFAVCAAIIWQFTGYAMVIYLAGLTGVPEELVEAATIDGAGAWRTFWSVKLPLINGAIVVNLLLSVIGTLKQFDQVVAMTNGGPGVSSETISTAIMKIAFSAGQYPKSIALAVLMTILIAVVAAVQFRLTSREVRA